MIGAFGVARFLGQNQKSPAVCIKEINDRLTQLNVAGEDVINVQVDTEFYHVFYKVKTA